MQILKKLLIWSRPVLLMQVWTFDWKCCAEIASCFCLCLSKTDYFFEINAPILCKEISGGIVIKNYVTIHIYVGKQRIKVQWKLTLEPTGFWLCNSNKTLFGFDYNWQFWKYSVFYIWRYIYVSWSIIAIESAETMLFIVSDKCAYAHTHASFISPLKHFNTNKTDPLSQVHPWNPYALPHHGLPINCNSCALSTQRRNSSLDKLIELDLVCEESSPQ